MRKLLLPFMVTIITLILLISGCFVPVSGEGTSLTLYLGGDSESANRAVLANWPPAGVDYDDLSYVIELSGPSGVRTETATGSGPITLSVPPGQYYITVTIYCDNGNELYARGETTVTVEPGKNNVVPMTVYRAGDYIINGVSISPNSPTVTKGGTQSFVATVNFGSNVSTGTDREVIWTISGQNVGGTVINPSVGDPNTGILAIDVSETASAITVTATSKVYSTMYATSMVTVTEQVNAITPALASLPGTQTYTEGDVVTPLTINVINAAEISAQQGTSPGGTGTTYQWYSALTNVAPGTIITGATSASFSPPVSMTEVNTNGGICWYYVEVTNNVGDNLDGGNKTASGTSTRTQVTVTKQAISGTVKITGTPIGTVGVYTLGNALTANLTEVINPGAMPTYVWRRDGTVIATATTNTYTPSATTDNVSYTVTVSYPDDRSNSLTSASVKVYREVTDISDIPNTNSGIVVNFILMNDITATACIGNHSGTVQADPRVFNGTFEGNGKTVTINIVNGAMTQPMGMQYTRYMGLFSCIGSSGEVRNLKLTGSITLTEPGGYYTSSDPYGYIGALAGVNQGTIKNVSSSVVISFDKSLYPQRAGGIVGLNSSGGIVQNCYSTGNVTVTKGTLDVNAGGIVGYNSGNQNAVVNCWASGSVSITGGSGTNGYVGGIVGNGPASYCVARNGGISAPAGMNGGRITGYLYTSSNNYANSTLQVSLGGTPQTPTVGGTTKDGDNFSAWNSVGWTTFPTTQGAATAAITLDPNAWPWWQTGSNNPKLWFEP